MDDDEAQRIVANEAARWDRAETLKAAKAIVARQRKAAIAKRTDDIREAELAVEVARERIAQRTDARLSTKGLASGASDYDVERFLQAKSRLAELEQTPLPEPGEPVRPEDRLEEARYCVTDRVLMRGGKCPVCQGQRSDNPFPRHEKSRLLDVLRRSPHGLA